MEPVFNLDAFQGKQRLLLIFAPSSENAIYEWLNKDLNEHVTGITDRRLLILKIFKNGQSLVGEEPLEESDVRKLRDDFRVRPNQFCVILIDKDGREKFREKKPVATEDIFSIIDALPSRKKEMRKD